jgi:hypothetical protein
MRVNIARSALWRVRNYRAFSASSCRREIRDLEDLPPRLIPKYQGVRPHLVASNLSVNGLQVG